MKRREFLRSATAFAGILVAGEARARHSLSLGLARAPHEPRLRGGYSLRPRTGQSPSLPARPPSSKLLARFGVISDIHVSEAEGSASVFEHALAYFDEMKCDGVVLCGDMADYGLVEELKIVGDAWFRAFPDGKRSDGEPIERLFIYGDHDMGGYMHKRVAEKNRPESVIPFLGPAEAWRAAFREEWAPVQVKTVKGFTFIMAHHPPHNEETKFGQRIPGVAEALAAHAPRDGSPFFFMQHRVYRDTAGGPTAWGQEDGESRAALEAYPNAIALCGHGHVEAQDEKSIWQGAFTAIEVPSLRYVTIRAGRENSRGADDVPSKQNPAINTGGGKQGMLMDVYADRIVVAKRDFIHDCEVAAPWVVPLPFPSGHPYDHAKRAAAEIAPQFPEGAKVEVKRRKGKDRAGNDQEQFGVYVAPCHSTAETPRAFDYEVTAEIESWDVVRIAKQKRFFSYNGHFPEEYDVKPTGFMFAKSELSAHASKIRFLVRPCGPFGAKGRAISSEWMKY